MQIFFFFFFSLEFIGLCYALRILRLSLMMIMIMILSLFKNPCCSLNKFKHKDRLGIAYYLLPLDFPWARSVLNRIESLKKSSDY